MKNFIKKNKLIILILFLAFALRVWGINYALPQFFVNDERALVYGALKMMELKTVIPAWHQEEFRVLNYLPVSSYIYLVFLAPIILIKYIISGLPDLISFKNDVILNPAFIWISARIINAIIGVLNILVVYLLGLKIFNNRKAAILGALFLAFSFYHVQLSHVTRHWMPAVFFVYLGWLAAIKIYRKPSLKESVKGGIFGGLAFGANPSSAIVLVPLSLALWIRKKIFHKHFIALIITFSLISLFFVWLHPYGLTLAKGQANEIKLANIFEKSFSGFLSFIVHYLAIFIKYEIFIFIFSILGFIGLLKKDYKLSSVIAAFGLIYLSVFYLFFGTLSRAILMVLPIMSILAGFGIYLLLRKIKLKALQALILLLVFLPALALVVRYDIMLSRPDNRVVAAQWLYENTPEDSKILAYAEYLRLTNTKQGISNLKAIDESGLRVSDRVLLNLESKDYPRPSREALNLHFVSADSEYRQVSDIGFFTDKGYEFFIVEYENEDYSDLDSQIKSLITQSKLIKNFPNKVSVHDEIDQIYPWQLFNIPRFGNNVDIYKLN